jgi:hypothetical protein
VLIAPISLSHWVIPALAQIVFMIPLLAKKLRTRSKETNWGTAIVTMNSVLHSFGSFVLLLLISKDNRIPPR